MSGKGVLRSENERRTRSTNEEHKSEHRYRLPILDIMSLFPGREMKSTDDAELIRSVVRQAHRDILIGHIGQLPERERKSEIIRMVDDFGDRHVCFRQIFSQGRHSSVTLSPPVIHTMSTADFGSVSRRRNFFEIPAEPELKEAILDERFVMPEESLTCDICYETFPVGTSYLCTTCCSTDTSIRRMHMDCVLKWMEQSSVCPFCKSSKLVFK